MQRDCHAPYDNANYAAIVPVDDIAPGITGKINAAAACLLARQCQKTDVDGQM